MKNKFVKVVVLVFCLLSLFGCTNNQENKKDENPPVVEDKKEISIKVLRFDSTGFFLGLEEQFIFEEGKEYDLSSKIPEILKIDSDLKYSLYSVFGEVAGIATEETTVVAIYKKIIYPDDFELLGTWKNTKNDHVFIFENTGEGYDGYLSGTQLYITFHINAEESKLYIEGYDNLLERYDEYHVNTYIYKIANNVLTLKSGNQTLTYVKQ